MMFERLRNRVLALLRVPPEPQPPEGAATSLRVFRAGRNYYRLRMTGWAVTQVLALAGIIFWTVMLIDVQTLARERDDAPPASVEEVAKRLETFGQRVGEQFGGGASIGDQIERGWGAYREFLVQVASILPDWAVPLLWILKVGGIAVYLIQLPLTYAVRRLDFEMRWYMVTDRSLRLRHGVWRVWEMTMSFANIQQVEVTQGPLQRLLGLGDVKVQSAGGGSGAEKHAEDHHDLHVGRFQSVEHATEIRDLILDRLRRFRDAGLGDPDESEHAEVKDQPDLEAASAASRERADPLQAAAALLAAAKDVRAAAEQARLARTSNASK